MTFEELYENIFEESIPEELLSEAKSDGLYFEGLTLSLSASQELASELQSEDCREFAEEITPICEEWYHKAKKRIPRYRRFAKYWLGASAKIAVKIFARKAGKVWGGRLEQLLKVFRERFLEGVERGVGDSEQFVNTLVEELCTYYVMTALYPTRTNNEWKRVVSLLRYKDANWLNELDVYKFMLILVISGTDITPQNIKLADAVEELVEDMPEKNKKNEEDEEELSELQELDEVLEENLAAREEFNQLERRMRLNSTDIKRDTIRYMLQHRYIEPAGENLSPRSGNWRWWAMIQVWANISQSLGIPDIGYHVENGQVKPQRLTVIDREWITKEFGTIYTDKDDDVIKTTLARNKEWKKFYYAIEDDRDELVKLCDEIYAIFD